MGTILKYRVSTKKIFYTQFLFLWTHCIKKADSFCFLIVPIKYWCPVGRFEEVKCYCLHDRCWGNKLVHFIIKIVMAFHPILFKNYW